MGIYQDQLLPRFQDKVMARKPTRDVRARVCAGLAGEVVEVGFGTGLNARYYPAAVTKVVAIEPSSLCMRLAAPRIARSGTPVVECCPSSRTGTPRTPRSLVGRNVSSR
jgi:hypothetical protein